MAGHGRPKGLPKTGGRVKGTPNKKDAILQQRIARSGKTPLEFMLSIMDDDQQPLVFRADMASKAAPYVHPRKVDHGEDRPANNTTVIIGGITDADRIEAVRQLLGKK